MELKPDFEPGLYGLIAEFSSPTELVHAAAAVRSAGYEKIDAFRPFPIHQLSGALQLPKSKVPLICLAGGISGVVGGFGLQYWASTIAYPFMIGGRPFNSWVAFIPPTFETMILLAAFSTVIGMFLINGLPEPYHPVFNHPRFERASQDGYFLVVEAADPKFDRAETETFLKGLAPMEVAEVAR
jgi:hypothetical protein